MIQIMYAIIGLEDFISDYNEEILADYRIDTDEILENIIAEMEEAPESYKHLYMDAQYTVDACNKVFSFTSYADEEGLRISYLGVNDE